MSFSFSQYAKFPQPLKNKIYSQMWNYNQTNLAILETSHRSPVFAKVNDDTISSLREYLGVPSQYKVLLMQGGEQLVQGSIPFNLLRDQKKCTYLVTGPRSEFASSEAKFHAGVTVNILNEQQFQTRNVEDSVYTYACLQDHQTGYTIPQPTPLEGELFVLDCTSALGLCPIPIEKYGIVFGAVEYSLGLPGVSIVIVREDLVGKEMKECPNMMSYATMNEKKSIYNTPNCFAVYTLGEHIKYLLEQGGLESANARVLQKIEYLKDKLKGHDKVSIGENRGLILELSYKGEDLGRVCESLESKRVLKADSNRVILKIQSSTQLSDIQSLVEVLGQSK